MSNPVNYWRRNLGYMVGRWGLRTCLTQERSGLIMDPLHSRSWLLMACGLLLMSLPVQAVGSCEDDQFQCDAEKCIPRECRCDGDEDCADGSDEDSCGARPKCRKWFTCDDGQRIKCLSRCDQVPDCEDLSDEEGCLQLVYSLSTRTPRVIRNEPDADQVDSSDLAVIGVIIAGLILILTIIGVATFIYRKTRIVRQSYDNSDNLDTPLDQGRFETRRPSELCHTGPAAVSHYDTPLSNKPVPGARGDTHYDRLPKPVPYTGYGQEGNYDCPKLPVPVPGARGDTHYDTVRRPSQPVAYTGHSPEENYDCPRSPVAVYHKQRNYSTPRLPVYENNESEILYDSPKSHDTVYPEATYDHPRRPSHEEYTSTFDQEATYDLPRRLSNEEQNPTFVRNGYMLYDNPRSPVDSTHVPTIPEEDLQIYDTPAALPRPIANPRSTHTGVDDDHLCHSDTEDPIYANQNYIFNR